MAIGEPLPLVTSPPLDVDENLKDYFLALSAGFEILERRLLAIEESIADLDIRVIALENP